MKGDRAYALTLLCIHSLCTESLRRTCWQAPSCEFLNYVACAWAMTCARWWGWQFTSSFMMIYPCYFIHLHLSFCVALNSVPQNGALCFFENFLLKYTWRCHSDTILHTFSWSEHTWQTYIFINILMELVPVFCPSATFPSWRLMHPQGARFKSSYISHHIFIECVLSLFLWILLSLVTWCWIILAQTIHWPETPSNENMIKVCPKHQWELTSPKAVWPCD
jgi:hypothetical protein